MTVRDVHVAQLPIKLGPFLKLAGAVLSGGEAKRLIADGEVRVNGEQERRRGRHLEAGDQVALAEGPTYRVAHP